MTYLKVKQRKEGVSNSEYTTLRNHLDDLRREVRNALPASAAENRSQRSTGAYGTQDDRGTNRDTSTSGTSGSHAANGPRRA